MNENEVKRKWLILIISLGTNFDFMILKNFLSEADDENFFFEFKSDDEEPKKLIKEISAFANTYGGYILLGVNDDKTIGGCKKWTEQRIHITIHDCITPTPNFRCEKIYIKGKAYFRY